MNNTFAKYQPPYFWTRYRSFFTFQNIGLHTSGQDIDPSYFLKISASILLEQDIDPFYFWTYSSEIRNKGDPFSKLLE